MDPTTGARLESWLGSTAHVARRAHGSHHRCALGILAGPCNARCPARPWIPPQVRAWDSGGSARLSSSPLAD